MSTLLWDAQAAVKALLTAAVTVPVYGAGDLVGDDARAFVTVGEPADSGDTATAEQSANRAGNQWRDEVGDIPCTVNVWDGGTSIAPLRVTAKQLLTACTAAVLNDRTLSGLLVPPGLAEVVSVRLREGQTDHGALVSAGFTVRYSAQFLT